MGKSLSSSSWNLYNRAFREYNKFLTEAGCDRFPHDPQFVAYFAANLFDRGLAGSTITSYVSALSFWLKLLHDKDTSNCFLLQRVLLGIKKSRPTNDCRLPITKFILHRIVNALTHTVSCSYAKAMFKSMFLLSYYGLLRVGEITKCAQNEVNILLISDITITGNKISLTIQFRQSKHSSQICFRKVNATGDNIFCPLLSLLDYIKVRGQKPGFFIY